MAPQRRHVRTFRAVAYRQQPPPEAVKYAMVKAWDRFERIALVQGKTFQ